MPPASQFQRTTAGSSHPELPLPEINFRHHETLTTKTDTSSADPEIADPTPGAIGRLRQHRWLSIAVAASVGLLGGGGVAFAIHEAGTDGPSPAELAAHVNASERAVVSVSRELGDVRHVSALAAVAARAERAADGLDRRLVVIAGAGDVEARQAAESAVRPGAKLLRTVARANTVTSATLPAWTPLAAELKRHADTLGGAQTTLLPGAQPATNAAADAREGAEAVDKLVARAQRKLVRWRKATRAFRKRRAANRRRAVAYETSVSGLLGQYGRTRTDLQAWTNRIESEYTSIEEGYTELSVQKDARQRIRSEIAAQTPPPALAGTHSRVLAVMGQAIDAMDSALAGLDQLQESREDVFGSYDSYDETPSWQEFRSASARISQELPAAQAEWKRVTRTHIKHVTSGSAPKRPLV